MKIARWILFLLLAATAWTQAPASPQEPPTPPPSAMQAPYSHEHRMPSHDMQDMKAQVEKMRATLDQMKANLAKIQRSGYLQQKAEFDVELWQAIIQHIEGKVMVMSNAHESADMLKKISCCARCKRNPEQNPAAAPT